MSEPQMPYNVLSAPLACGVQRVPFQDRTVPPAPAIQACVASVAVTEYRAAPVLAGIRRDVVPSPAKIIPPSPTDQRCVASLPPMPSSLVV